MKTIKVIDPDVDIDYHGKVNRKHVGFSLLYLLVVCAIILSLLCSCTVQQKPAKTKWHIRLGDNREDPWANNPKQQ